MKRGQAATEYIIIAGFVFFALLVSITLLYKQGSATYGTIVTEQTNRICYDLIDVAEATYYMGVPSRQTLELVMPEGIVNMSLHVNPPSSNCVKCTELRFVVQGTEGSSTIVCSTNIDLQMDSPDRIRSPGTKKIRFQAYSSYVLMNITS